ncbi:MAG TPA: glycine betaine ABC transporter substrate-binding protein [Fimbriimonadaceae bacterium]|nr:glycine betaine ABC transporter substrate-binding protein [Fimbriimonadaceae bacterium]
MGFRSWTRSSHILLTLLLVLLVPFVRAQDVVVGSKKFTESYVLGEIAKKVIQDTGLTVEHRQGMGATGILWEALKKGEVTMYPEYTGTLWQELLKDPKKPTMTEMRAECAKLGIGVSDPLGFNNTYALVMSDEKADKLGIKTMSDLAKHPELNAGPDPEFLGRKDGWGPMCQAYGLKFASTRAIDHGLVYRSVAHGDIDVTDCYSTDAQIAQFHLRVLDDDKDFFPAYRAVFLYRLNAPPKALEAIRTLEGKIDDATMRRLNAYAEEHKDYTAAANQFFGAGEKSPTGKPLESESLSAKILRYTLVHLKLVVISLLATILVAVPLGILASRRGLLSSAILGFAGIIQTIPSLALLVLLVPLLGIGQWTAILGLFLYSLLPIIRNTATGLQSIPTPIRESAQALGLEPEAQLTKIYLPMASRTILAGIKTAAVINVGTATLAGLLGAGGYGEAIQSGLNLNDVGIMLQGAVPAAILALLVQFLFDGLDRVLIPKGIR